MTDFFAYSLVFNKINYQTILLEKHKLDFDNKLSPEEENDWFNILHNFFSISENEERPIAVMDVSSERVIWKSYGDLD